MIGRIAGRLLAKTPPDDPRRRPLEVIEGEVEMHTNHALEDYEVRAGYVLSCQSFPVTDKVVVTFDE